MDELMQSGLMDEITAVLTQPTRPPIYGWYLEIQAGDQTVVPLRLMTKDLVRNYDSAYTDQVIVSVQIGAGTFAHDILPYRNNLTGTLYRQPLTAITGEVDLNATTDHQSVTITLLDGADEVKALKNNVLQSKQAGDMTRLLTVNMQLFDPVMSQLRQISCGGPYRNTCVQDLVKYLLSYYIQQIPSDDSTRAIGVRMHESVKTAPIPSTIIPHGTPLVDIPDFLHERVSGIYNAGLSSYMQGNVWHLNPLFDTSRYDAEPVGVTIINVPKNRFPHLERTYRTTARQVIILSTGDAEVFDDTEARQLNDGNGVRFASADRLFDQFSVVEGNKALALRAQNTNEYITQPRPDNKNNVRTSTNKVTNNLFLELSRQSRRQVSFLSCIWQNSDPDLILPAMPVRYMYLENGKLVELHGVIQSTHTYDQAAEPALMTRRHISTTTVRMCLARASENEST